MSLGILISAIFTPLDPRTSL